MPAKTIYYMNKLRPASRWEEQALVFIVSQENSIYYVRTSRKNAGIVSPSIIISI